MRVTFNATTKQKLRALAVFSGIAIGAALGFELLITGGFDPVTPAIMFAAEEPRDWYDRPDRYPLPIAEMALHHQPDLTGQGYESARQTYQASWTSQPHRLGAGALLGAAATGARDQAASAGEMFGPASAAAVKRFVRDSAPLSGHFAHRAESAAFSAPEPVHARPGAEQPAWRANGAEPAWLEIPGECLR
mgnify:CR=1 FL=1